MTTKIYACVVHDKRTLSLLKVFFHRFSGGREKKRVFVNVFHTNKVFRLDARPENDKTKRAFLCCVKKKDAKKREREIHFFPVVVRFTDSFSPTFQIAPCPCLWTRTVVKSPSPFPPQTKKKNKKKHKKLDGGETPPRRKCAVETSSQNEEEALFRRFYISKEEKEDDFDGRDPSNSYLSLE